SRDEIGSPRILLIRIHPDVLTPCLDSVISNPCTSPVSFGKAYVRRPSSDQANTLGTGTSGQYSARRRRQATSFCTFSGPQKRPLTFRTSSCVPQPPSGRILMK